MEQISGYVNQIIFSNADNGYTVFELTTDTGVETCVGILHALNEGEVVSLEGDYTVHNVYGKQFAVESYSIMKPTSELAIRRYLSSGAIKGIGEGLAKRIVDMFGEDTFRIMEEEPELLARVKGISINKAQQIAAVVLEKKDIREAMIFLQKFGVSNNLAMKIYNRYGQELYSVLSDNPYRLVEDIEGVGFKTADEIAYNAGIAVDSVYRIKSGILYTISLFVQDGHTYVPKPLFLDKSEVLLGVERDAIWLATENLSIERKLVLKQVGEDTRIYSNTFYNMEQYCAGMLRDLDITVEPRENKIRDEIININKKDELELDEKQVEAVVKSITQGVCVITGGPGTGKTTTINTIIKYLERNGDDFVLTAPTGRAAKRMTEATGYEAYTIQRLLGLNPSAMGTRGYAYDKNETNPLETDMIIVDEMSMVDLPVFKALLCAIIPGTRLVMVGDANQLPSVGPGSVLKDVLASGKFSTVRLEKIYRQEGLSEIVINAHKINAGIVPSVDNTGKDFFFLKRADINAILKHMILLVTQKLPGYVNATSFDIQILTPMRKGPLGVNSLNPILQKYINPPAQGKAEKEFGDVTFREGDKVMQTKNNYQLEWEIRGMYGMVIDKGTGVFNGNMGVVSKIDTYSDEMEVVYDENRVVRYTPAEYDELELAYAVTVHKSQGSEYPAIVMPLLNGPRQLLNRNLLYTAITRAKQCVVILGSEDTFAQMVHNVDENKRFTSLDEAIGGVYL